MKCDEGRPSCNRCTRSETSCEYPVPKNDKLLKRHAAAQYLPLKAAPSRQYHLLGATRPSERLGNETEADYRCLRLFQHKTMSGFQGVMNWSLWNHLVLQFSHHEPFVRDCVVAIGSLISSLEVASVPKVSSPDSSLGAEEETAQSKLSQGHRQFALLKYGKAVKAMQTVLPNAEPRQVMIASLLVFCFETLLGNRYFALSHVVSAERLFRRLLPPTESVPRRGGSNLLSPALVDVEDELVEAFEHLDLQIITIHDSRPVAFHRSILRESHEFVQNMPEIFTSIAEAGRYLNLVMRRSHHFIATSWATSESASLAGDFSSRAPTKFAVASGTNVFSTSGKVTDELRDEQKEYAREVARWMHAFEPLYNMIQILHRTDTVDEGTQKRDYIIATLLRLHLLTTLIIVAGVVFTTECSYDAYLPEFAEMIDLADIIFDAYQNRHSRQKGKTNLNDNLNTNKTTSASGNETPYTVAETVFSLDLGLTPCLFLLIVRCRDGQLRRRALDICMNWHMEGCWTPELIAEYGRFLMEVEEEGIVTDDGTESTQRDGVEEMRFPKACDIPEQKRAVVSKISETHKAGVSWEALMQVVLRCGGPDGGPVWREKYIKYKHMVQ